MRVYLAEPLPADVADAVRAALAKHDILPAVPGAHAGLQKSERDRFLAIVDRMMEAEMLVADVSERDAGVGWCVSWMLARGRLVVLACRKDARASLDAMIAGNPSPWQRLVVYADADDLQGQLEKMLGSS